MLDFMPEAAKFAKMRSQDAYGKEARLQVGAWLVIVQIGLPAALQLQK